MIPVIAAAITRSNHVVVTNIFCWDLIHSEQRYPVGVCVAHLMQIGLSQRLHLSRVSVFG